MRKIHPRSPLRWAGGKGYLAPALLELLPPLSPEARFLEPLCGGAALFFSRQDRHKTILADTNENLINFWKVLREYPRELFRELQNRKETLEVLHSDQEAYLICREEFNQLKLTEFSSPSVPRAALFYYLNQTSYNGLWRENSRGEYNVPYGKRPVYLDESRLLQAHRKLEQAFLLLQPFERTLGQARRGDLVYLDPPYLGKTFTSYRDVGFRLKDQEALAACAQQAAQRGVYILASNTDCPEIRELWSFCPRMIPVSNLRSISAKGSSRGLKTELLLLGWE
jgi:DNA adenine methylase